VQHIVAPLLVLRRTIGTAERPGVEQKTLQNSQNRIVSPFNFRYSRQCSASFRI
jgi:hypothetical protein